jgi:CheY-like chemotaxis protein
MNGTVLYVEDNHDNVHLVQLLLKKRRPTVTLVVAANGTEGLRLARQTVPSFILLDRRLPDMLGNEVLRQLKAVPATATIPVVMLSGDSGGEADELLRLGADEFLTKPFEINQLLVIVDRYCDPPAADR